MFENPVKKLFSASRAAWGAALPDASDLLAKMTVNTGVDFLWSYTPYAFRGLPNDDSPNGVDGCGRSLTDLDDDTGGPARYVRVAETGGKLGFITPMTHNFCESCNRVRVTCTGTLYMCLGQEDAADLRAPLRASSSNALIHQAIDEAISRKPKGHDFIIDRDHNRPAVARHMSVTGG